MRTTIDICSLDYLIGTLSTAYKGVITSLVAKDFCMTGAGDTVSLKGRILSMPAGNYEASLINRGVELARTGITEGSFEFQAGSEQVRQARELQIDIIQQGRHIGTFLLKNEGAGGAYLPAVELSEEIKGMDFKLLTVPLRGKAGLLEKAEKIVAAIHSTKKDWPVFSELLHGFAVDVFWAQRNVFYDGYAILARFAVKAAEKADRASTNKPATNVLDLIELPLEREEDERKLRYAADIWLKEVSRGAVDLASELGQARSVLRSLHERFPGADIGPALAGLLGSLRKKLGTLPSVSGSFLDSLRGRMNPGEFALLARYGEEGRREIAGGLARAQADGGTRNYGAALDFLSRIDTDALDDGKMIETFLDAAGRYLDASSAGAFPVSLSEVLSLPPALSPVATSKIVTNLPDVMKRLLALGRPELCEALLFEVARTGPPLREEIVMNTRTAAVILNSGSEELVARYRDILTAIVIPAAKVRGVSTESWAEVVNPQHIELLAKFMELIESGSGRFQTVLVHVIANLYVSGVFIPDDKLFQRRVSAWLNSEAMRGDFLLNYLFLRKLPVYYHEIGAVDRIRDLSTELDSWGNDPVLYFVRKQVHANASNYNVKLIEKVLAAWAGSDPGLLRDAVPRDVLESLPPGLLERYSPVVRPLFESLGAIDARGLHFERLLDVPEEAFREKLGSGGLDEIRAKVTLLCMLYQEIAAKYIFAGGAREQGDVAASLTEHLARMREHVRTARAPEKTSARESLYFKRHIAFGIPSVLGSYQEPKFDAMAELLRDDARVSVLLEEIISGIGARVHDFTTADVSQWLHVLALSSEVLSLHGFGNRQVEEFVAVSESNRLHLSQIADLLRMWQKELAWMVDFFNRTFHEPVAAVLKRFPTEDLPDILMNLDPASPDFASQAADIVVRNMVSSVPGLVETDRIIELLLGAIPGRVERGADDFLKGGGVQDDRKYFVLHELGEDDAVRLAPLLGGKAKNLVVLADRGFLVPAGAVLSASLTAGYRDASSSEAFAALKRAVKAIEDRTGMVFGGGTNPLFLSVRSGSYVSMPGILSTILYCGMNGRTLQGLMKATGDPLFAWDSYRRFIEQYGTVVMGLGGAIFERIMFEELTGFGLSGKEDLDAGHMEAIVGRYLEELSRRGLTIPDDVYEQLVQAIRSVYASWFDERALQFRRATRTSAQWGTAVTVMQMVYGNRDGSGASVFFTRNPISGEKGVYGETRERAAGEDLVHGKQRNRPIAKRPRRNEAPAVAEDARDKHGGEKALVLSKSLEETDPELFSLHQKLADEIEDAMGGLPQEVEVTYTTDESGARRIWVLQTRRMEMSTGGAASFDAICRMESQVIGRGLAAHGGAQSGVASFATSPEAALRLRRDSGLPVILLRTTANTDDVSLMPVIGGIVTSSGGVTSHAAVLAGNFGVDAVVACADMVIGTDEAGQPVARFGGTVIKEGSSISIDGAAGLVFSGLCMETE